MNGAIIAFDPCHACESHDMCSRCELTLRRDGALRTDKWISVEERLPDTQQEVLTYSECNGVRSACLIGAKDDIKMWYLYKSDKLSISVTHWMPLPEAPKMEDGDE
jgi:hypothetical protein